jgi:hypothetical protein
LEKIIVNNYLLASVGSISGHSANGMKERLEKYRKAAHEKGNR